MKDDKMLLDNFELSGTDRQSFFEVLDAIDSCTSMIPFDLADCSVLHYRRDVEELQDGKKTGKKQFWLLRPEEWDGEKGKIISIKDDNLKRKLTPELIQEWKEHATALYENTDRQIYLLSSMATQTLLMKTGVGGEKAVQSSLARDRYLASCMSSSKPAMALVRTTDSGKPKIFAFFSQKYKYAPQAIIRDIIEDITKTGTDIKFRKWYVSHKLSECFIEFPEKGFTLNGETWIPGLRICTSDTGYSSTTITCTWRNGESVTFMKTNNDEIRHYGDKDMKQEIRTKTKDIAKMQKEFENAMKTLNKQALSAPSADVMQELYLNLFLSSIKKIGIEDVLGSKRINTLLCSISAEHDWNLSYTLASVATEIMKLPGIISSSTISQRNKLATGCGKAPFVVGI